MISQVVVKAKKNKCFTQTIFLHSTTTTTDINIATLIHATETTSAVSLQTTIILQVVVKVQ